jgi:hypothetical protein
MRLRAVTAVTGGCSSICFEVLSTAEAATLNPRNKINATNARESGGNHEHEASSYEGRDRRSESCDS